MDCVQPLEEIQRLFSQNSDKSNWGVWNYFEELQIQGRLNHIPYLTPEVISKLAPNSLVRYRGMVQDIFDPEFYVGKFYEHDNLTGEKVLRHGKYQDLVTVKQGTWIDWENATETYDRMIYYCVPIPAESSWAKPVNEYPNARVNENQFDRLKRAREEGGDESERDNGQDKESIKKRKKEHASMENKVLPDLNMPVPTEGTPVLLKVYDEDTIKLNTLIEVVGILSPMDPDAVSNSERDAVHEMFGTTREEIFAHSPPSSLVPRLHAVFITKLGEANPLVQCQLTHEESIEQLSLLQHVRELLLDHMAKSLGGDRLAAEYLFLQLTSRVYARSGILPLGTVLLNLTHWKCNQGNWGVISQILVGSCTKVSSNFPLCEKFEF
eukprot:TRINITY_DN4486_c0_g1_i7.p2 TRINITY_DN4486_c0_g1~~TRINITY_DN4486_c0_g1_i7.p2  ORF type:complete len:381 (-),score=69.33 TRINITY_DN4486_c0_g1_i7:1934-3076(-)